MYATFKHCKYQMKVDIHYVVSTFIVKYVHVHYRNILFEIFNDHG